VTPIAESLESWLPDLGSNQGPTETEQHTARIRARKSKILNVLFAGLRVATRRPNPFRTPMVGAAQRSPKIEANQRLSQPRPTRNRTAPLALRMPRPKHASGGQTTPGPCALAALGPNASHLEHQPLEGLVEVRRILRHEPLRLFGQVDQDRTGLEQRQRLGAAAATSTPSNSTPTTPTSRSPAAATPSSPPTRP
jgi:hypothetical protein